MKNSNNPDYNYCVTVGQTDTGRRRKANEDYGAHFITQNGLVSVVCDGMGGHVGGAIASETAVHAIHDFLDSQYYEDPREAIGLAIEAANHAIIQRAAINPELTGMGSTCVLLIVRNAQVYIGHVGDSRIYLIREKRITQLTKDHSFVQMLVDLGEITKEQAEHHPRKNEITNALGLPEMTPATVKEEPITPHAGDCFLLCSDGLSGMVSDDNIEKIVSKQRELRTQERADLLVQTANKNGGVDNITVELVEFTITPGSPSPKTRKNRTAKIISVSVLLCAALLGMIWILKFKPKTETVSWGSVVFGKGETVFTIKTNPALNNTIIQFNDSTHVIDHVLKDASQIVTNLDYRRDANHAYAVMFGDTIPDNTDSVYVQLNFGRLQYIYVLRLQKKHHELPVIVLQPQTLAGVTYAKNQKFASLTFIPTSNDIILSVNNTLKPIEISGKLYTESIRVNYARSEYSTGTDHELWTMMFDESTPPDTITISFVCEDKSSQKEYTYNIPVKTTIRSVHTPTAPQSPQPSRPATPTTDDDLEYLQKVLNDSVF